MESESQRQSDGSAPSSVAFGTARGAHGPAQATGSPMLMKQQASVSSIRHSPRALAQRAQMDRLLPSASVNRTGLPNQLKAGIEHLSGMSLDAVRVHYHSSKPAQLNAYAYTQGTDIHVAPGQEHHLPHEAWHVAQQAQGRVQPTTQRMGVQINENPDLEAEATSMGRRALEGHWDSPPPSSQGTQLTPSPIIQSACIQASKVETKTASYTFNQGTETETVGVFMRAHLDPNHQINGSAPGDGEQDGLMSYLKNTKKYQSMKRGHLMNGQLGGPGIAANLFPITSKANSHHQFFVENHVKEAISNGMGVVYQVQVNSELNADSLMQGAAEFRCNAWVWDPTGNIIDLTQPAPFAEAVITSYPKANSSGDGGYDEKVNPSLRFPSKNLPYGWGEKGKGLSHWKGKLPPHFSSS